MAKFTKKVVRDVTSLGSFMFYGILMLFSLIVSKTLFWELLTGFLLTAAIVVVIRLFYFKNRPKKQTYDNVLQRIDASSFPSLHTARVVFLAVVLSRLWADVYATIIFWGLAIAVMFSRIYLKKHDLIDIIGGVVLAVLTVWIVGMI